MPTTNTNQSDDGIVERLDRIARYFDEGKRRSPRSAEWIREATDHIRTLEARLAAVEGEKAKVKADAIELCAFAADGLAEMARAGGITGRSDPLEATLLDEQFSQFAADLRRQKPQALGASL